VESETAFQSVCLCWPR